MYIFICLLGLIISYGFTAVIYKKTDAGKLAIAGTINYFAFYIIISGLLIWFDKFSVMNGSLLTLVTLFAGTVIAYFIKGKEMPAIQINKEVIKKYIPVLILMIIFGILSHNKSELFSTSQDQGLYEIQAMMYIAGDNANHHELKEYYELGTEYQKQEYLQGLSELEGIYFTNATYGTEGCGTEYEVHGISTFAAMLALYGKMFGTENMAGIQTVFYLMTIGAVWIICENMKFKNIISYLTCAMTGLCPIILWCSKVVLTEIVLCMLIAMFFAYVTEDTDNNVTAFCALPIVAYAYYHITITIMIPLFVIITVIMYMYTKKSSMLLSFLAVLGGYTTGMEMMYKSSPFYTQKNIEPIIRVTKGLFTIDNFHKVVFAVCVILGLIAIVLHFTKVLEKIRQYLEKRSEKDINGKLWIITGCAITLGLVSFFIYKGMKTVDMGLVIGKMSILVYFYMTGFILVPVCMFGFIKNLGTYTKSGGKLAIAISTIYAMLVMTGLIWPDIYVYYYYARYFAPYMILVLIMAAAVLNEMSLKIAVPVFVVSGVVTVICSPIVYTETDLRYGDYTVATGISECISDTDAVIMYADVMGMHKMLMLPVKTLSGCDIYFAGGISAEDLAVELGERYNNVYLLIYDAGYVENDLSPWTRIYHDTLSSSFFEGEGDIIPYPDEIKKFESSVGLLRYRGYQ